MSSVTSHTAHPERPERSRNARAQARHRAKRKAYIEQLEQTVTKLQTALGLSSEEVAALPPPFLKIRGLEQDNARLEKENDDLRRMLSDTGVRGLPVEMDRRNSLSTFQDTRVCDRDYKRRKMTGNVEGAYMCPSESPPQSADSIRPPPLTIPQPMPHHYSYVPSNPPTHGVPGSSSMFSLHGPTFQMPNTPSGSSATSSPPFSPAQMQEPLHSPVDHRPISNNHVMQNYTQRSNHYGSVKVEDEHYVKSNHNQPHNGHYALPPPYTHETNGMESWHAYSSERAHLHR